MTGGISIGILGATSYTGTELIALLLRHPSARLSWLTSETRSGVDLRAVFPKFIGRIPDDAAQLRAYKEVSAESPDVVFSCLPHGTSAEFCAPFLRNGRTRVVDLSADFRMKDVALYEKFYGVKHPCPEFLSASAFGLCELRRDEIRKARVVGNPGCYPTSVLLPLIPLLRAGIVEAADLIADSKSGVSGAGMKPTDTTHYCNCNESVSAYKIGDQHRHLSEMGDQLAQAAGAPAGILFTPHLLPMERGILSTLYCRLVPGRTAEEATACLREQYFSEPFVQMVDQPPATRDVRGTNFCHIHLVHPRQSGRIIIVSVIDNLMKGAAGQALQNMNILFGLDETAGLR